MRSSCVLSSLVLLSACVSSSRSATSEPTPPPPAVARAAPPNPLLAEARAQLESREPAHIAWGAWTASSNQLTELAPLVALRLAAVRAEPATEEQLWVLRALGDAAFQLGAHVPPAEIAQLGAIGQLRPLALVLATHDAAANVALYEQLFPDAVCDEDLAVRNLLAQHAPAWIAPRLVPVVAITLTVKVRDGESYGSSGGSHTSGIGCGSLAAPPDFPPSVLYTLHHGAPYDGVVAAGPIPVVYERTVRAEREFGIGSSFDGVDATEYALRLLRWMSGDRAERGGLRTELELVHRWSDVDSLLYASARELRVHSAAWSALLGELERRGALDHATAARPAPITVKFVDERKERDVDLPAPPR